MKKGIIAIFLLFIALSSCKKKEDQKIYITITPTNNTLVGLVENIQLVATARDENSQTLDISASLIEWSSADTLVATVDNSGWVRPRGPGLARINAEYDGFIGSASVNVCVCYKELYNYTGPDIVITREIIDCNDYLNKVYADGMMDQVEAIDQGALELDTDERIILLKKKICE